MELIYCASGNRLFGQIAIDNGMNYGAQLPNTIYHNPYFVDQNWKKPNLEKYLKSIIAHRPPLATVLDYDDNTTRNEVLMWGIGCSVCRHCDNYPKSVNDYRQHSDGYWM